MTGRNFVRADLHRVIQKRLELDFGVAQNVGVGRAAGLVFAQKFSEHAVFVVGGKVDVFDLDADHVGNRCGVYKVDVRRAIAHIIITRPCGSVVVFPVLHEDADDLVALLFEQIRGHRRVHAPAQSHHDPLLCL